MCVLRVCFKGWSGMLLLLLLLLLHPAQWMLRMMYTVGMGRKNSAHSSSTCRNTRIRFNVWSCRKVAMSRMSRMPAPIPLWVWVWVWVCVCEAVSVSSAP